MQFQYAYFNHFRCRPFPLNASYFIDQFTHGTHAGVWPGDVMVRALDLQLKGRGFDLGRSAFM